ncbi:conserved hypothetical protein, partial [Ricinus communis]
QRGQDREARAGEHELAAQPLRGKPVIRRGRKRIPVRDDQVSPRQVLLQRELAGAARALAHEDALERHRPQDLMPAPGRQFRRLADGEIHLPLFQHGRDAERIGVDDRQPHRRRLPAQHAEQDRRQPHLHPVRHPDDERVFGARRVERRLFEQRAVDGRQRGPEPRFQLQRTRRRLHAEPSADHQRIVEQFAQAPQRAADRRLAEVEPLGRARHAALLQQHQEGHEQVQVDAPEISFADIHYPHNRFE